MEEEKTLILKQRLEQEKAQLEEELSTVGEKDPDNPEDWMPTAPDMDTLEADPSERADAYEAFGENVGILDNLETRYANVKDALTRMEDGTYGICAVCGEEIEEERLEANPAAATCIMHKDEEV
ncbi:MAG: TraR/DksA family transcriptional regulator [Patescibacteria group bacterium]